MLTLVYARDIQRKRETFLGINNSLWSMNKKVNLLKIIPFDSFNPHRKKNEKKN